MRNGKTTNTSCVRNVAELILDVITFGAGTVVIVGIMIVTVVVTGVVIHIIVIIVAVMVVVKL